MFGQRFKPVQGFTDKLLLMVPAAETMIAAGYEKEFFRITHMFENDLRMRWRNHFVAIPVND